MKTKALIRRIAICASYDLQWRNVTRHLRECLAGLGEGVKDSVIGILTLLILPFYFLLYWPSAPFRWMLAACRHKERIDHIGFRPTGKTADPHHYK